MTVRAPKIRHFFRKPQNEIPTILFKASRIGARGPVGGPAGCQDHRGDPLFWWDRDVDGIGLEQCGWRTLYRGVGVRFGSDLPVSYTHLRAHETPEHLVCRLLLEKKKKI